MAGGAYVSIALFSGLGAGLVGRTKGSSFWIWFLLGAIVPLLGVLVAVAYRDETAEPDGACPRCGTAVKLHQALCTRCGQELGYPGTPGADPAPRPLEPAAGR